jgi:hypothetical protein
VPVKEFPVMNTVFSWVSDPKASSMVPVRPFRSRIRLVSRVRRPMALGMVDPVKLMLVKISDSRPVSTPSCGAIDPPPMPLSTMRIASTRSPEQVTMSMTGQRAPGGNFGQRMQRRSLNSVIKAEC